MMLHPGSAVDSDEYKGLYIPIKQEIPAIHKETLQIMSAAMGPLAPIGPIGPISAWSRYSNGTPSPSQSEDSSNDGPCHAPAQVQTHTEAETQAEAQPPRPQLLEPLTITTDNLVHVTPRTLPTDKEELDRIYQQAANPLNPEAFVATYGPAVIQREARFRSFADFEKTFDDWKRANLHAFRVASSEHLRTPEGFVDPVFRYRYVVYHCARYGEPRMRGVGKRPKQTYLPCGCHAMLRLNYCFAEKSLKITTLVEEHTEHDHNESEYNKVAQRAVKKDESFDSESRRSWPKSSPAMQAEGSPAEPVGTNTEIPTASILQNHSVLQPSPQAAMSAFLHQQQMLALARTQILQKENQQEQLQIPQHHLQTFNPFPFIPQQQPNQLLNILTVIQLQQQHQLEQQRAQHQFFLQAQAQAQAQAQQQQNYVPQAAPIVPTPAEPKEKLPLNEPQVPVRVKLEIKQEPEEPETPDTNVNVDGVEDEENDMMPSLEKQAEIPLIYQKTEETTSEDATIDASPSADAPSEEAPTHSDWESEMNQSQISQSSTTESIDIPVTSTQEVQPNSSRFFQAVESENENCGPPSKRAKLELDTSSTNDKIYQGACFSSFDEFEEAFEFFKRSEFHPFRIASSEALRDFNGVQDSVFKYRYIVYHCAHYGDPRMRGVGKRPNQNYLPCGCRAMLRINYNFQDKVLKLSSLNTSHNHEISEEHYHQIVGRKNASKHNSPRPSTPQVKSKAKKSLTPLTTVQPQGVAFPAAAASPVQYQQMHQAMASTLAVVIQRQQQMLLIQQQQQKENFDAVDQPVAPAALPPHLQGLPRPQPQQQPINPLNILTLLQQHQGFNPFQLQPSQAATVAAPIAAEPGFSAFYPKTDPPRSLVLNPYSQ